MPARLASTPLSRDSALIPNIYGHDRFDYKKGIAFVLIGDLMASLIQ